MYQEAMSDADLDRLEGRRRAVGGGPSKWVMVCVPMSTVGVLLCLGISIVSIALAQSAVDKADQVSVSIPKNIMRTQSFRLMPGDELISGIMRRVTEQQLQAAWISTCVGSLTQYSIRYANQDSIAIGEGHFEIVSLVGTMTSNGGGQHHIHISIGDGTGKTISGHLSDNSTIYTTAEVVIGYDCSVTYKRAVDGSTPWDELQITAVPWC